MDSQQVRDTFLEALAEIDENSDGLGLFDAVIDELNDAIVITETSDAEVKIDATALIEGALEAMAVLGGVWAAERRITLQAAARQLLNALQAREGGLST
jgi:hypothetical protein